ncbi:uncharacterized protein PAC_05429 [Phialocephala subalpina]|uniref:Uncharacterized protein n=1 Tax=Phialocephala subalpina TaxID=576137 RepID=A0A1L7WRZ3_9HELO|nr:uncharacterized protein PAC_05429 [Phialocephala subalpina]
MEMSGSGSDSTSRGLSDDTWSGKRTAEGDEKSGLSDPPKRARRGGSGFQSEEEQAQDFIVVSSRRDSRKSDDRRETDDNRTAPSSQPSSRLSSPLSSAPSRLTEDCGEMAQKAMEAWQSTLAAMKSETHGHEMLPGPSGPTHEVRTSSIPRSPGPPSGEGSMQAREWLDTPHTSTDRIFRTPLPTEKEPRIEAPSSRNSNSPLRSNDSGQAPAQDFGNWNAQAQPLSASQPSTELSQGDSSERQNASRSVDYPPVIPKDSFLLNVRDTSGWHRNENRQLPPISSMSLQLSGIGKNTLPQPIDDRRAPVPVHIAGGLEGGLNTFPSNFSVLTAETVQRNQASGNRIGKRRGKKPGTGYSNRTDDRPGPGTPPRFGLDNQQPGHFLSRHEVRPEDGQSRPSPQSKDQLLSPQTLSAGRKPAITNSAPHIHHIVQPQRSTTPPPTMTQPSPFQPPPVIFTLDNRAESPLATLDVQPFIESFTQNTSVLLPIPTSDKEASAHPVSVIMWQSLLDFYKWYAEASKVKEVGPLMFELVDVHWQEERSFVVPEGSLSYFRTIKQYIWDLYWLAANINKAPALFRVLVTPLPPHSAVSPTSQDSRCNPVNTKLSDLPAAGHGSGQQRQMATEITQSTPQCQLAPSPSLPNTILGNRPMSSHRPHQDTSPMSVSAALQSLPSSSHNSFDPTRRIDHNLGGHHRHQSLPSQSQPIGSPNIHHARTTLDQTWLRERAHAFIADRPDAELLDRESTVLDKLPYKTGAEVCGVVIDKRSGKGMVAITGKGYITLNVRTGPDEPGDRYQEVTIQPKQTCMLHGEAVVLFYRRKPPPPEPQQQASQSSHATQSQPPSSNTSPDPEITIRLQIDGTGKFSSPYPKSVLRPKITTTEFFSWFSTQTGHCQPHGPRFLKFTFKDAMPVPTSTEIQIGNEDHFGYMRRDVKVQCEKARKWMGGLREFGVLVSVPGWTARLGEGEGDEEEW